MVRWLWLVAGNRYLQYDAVREVGVLDEDGWLTVGGGVQGAVQNIFKRSGIEKEVGNKNFKKGTCWLKEWVS